MCLPVGKYGCRRSGKNEGSFFYECILLLTDFDLAASQSGWSRPAGCLQSSSSLEPVSLHCLALYLTLSTKRLWRPLKMSGRKTFPWTSRLPCRQFGMSLWCVVLHYDPKALLMFKFPYADRCTSYGRRGLSTWRISISWMIFRQRLRSYHSGGLIHLVYCLQIYPSHGS